MSKNTYSPYTYLIGWSRLDKWYYGAKYSSNTYSSESLFNANSDKPYLTSSNAVGEFIEKYGWPDVIKVRKTFSDKESCLLWEHRVLKRLDAKNNEKFLNRSNGAKLFGQNSGFKMPEKAKDKIRNTVTAKNVITGMTTRVPRDEFILNSNLIHPAHQKEVSALSRERISQKAKGKVTAIDIQTGRCVKVSKNEFYNNENLRGANYGKDVNSKRVLKPSYHRNQSNAQIKAKLVKVKCEHCYKETDRSNYARWHGNNCKQITNRVGMYKLDVPGWIQIPKDQVDEYLARGYVIGQRPREKQLALFKPNITFRWIVNSDNVVKRVPANDIQKYLNQGFVIGRIFRTP
jgi:hypothetical protein